MLKKSSCLILFLLLAFSSNIIATHSAGAELTYRFLSHSVNGDTYEITATLYRDCSGVAAPATIPITLSSVNCNYTNSAYTLSKIAVTGQEITLPCSTAQTKCTNPNSTIQGFQKYVYRGNIILPFECSDWRISYSVIARNCAITTIQQGIPCGQTTPLYVEAMIDNSNVTSNESPVFTNNPIIYICLNQNTIYNNGVIEHEGDSLYFELVDALQAHNNIVPYLPPYSGVNPLTSSPPVSINHSTGDITMNAQALEIGIITIKISEYRNGMMIGSVMRDMQFIVVDCLTNVLPTASGINGTADYSTTACAGNTLSFFINSDDTNASQNLTMSYHSGIAGASFIITGTIHPTLTFTWTPTVQDARPQPYTFTVTVTDDNCPLNTFLTYSYYIYVSYLTVQSTVTPCSTPTASDGAIDLTINSSMPPYTILWTPTGDTTEDLNGLTQGIYSVLITDLAGCYFTDTFSVSVCSNFSAVLVSQQDSNGYNVSCNGDSNGVISAIATGGAGPYTYDWGNGPTIDSFLVNVPAGFYSVDITDQWGCIITQSGTLTEPTAIQHLGNSAHTICVDSSVLITEPPGNTYSWSTGDTTNTLLLRQPGIHTVVITDSLGCSLIDTISVTNYPAMDTTIATGVLSFCEGDSVLLSAASGYSYTWSTGETTQSVYQSQSGNIFIALLDTNGCRDTSAVITVTEFLPPIVPVITLVADSLIITNPEAGNYSWYLDGNATGITGEFYSHPGDGLYYCVFTDSNGCSSTSNTILITGISQTKFSKVEIYPNPTSGKCRITSNAGDPIRILQVYNLMGEMIYSEQLWNPLCQFEFDFFDFPEGVYIFRLSTQHSVQYSNVTVSK